MKKSGVEQNLGMNRVFFILFSLLGLYLVVSTFASLVPPATKQQSFELKDIATSSLLSFRDSCNSSTYSLYRGDNVVFIGDWDNTFGLLASLPQNSLTSHALTCGGTKNNVSIPNSNPILDTGSGKAPTWTVTNPNFNVTSMVSSKSGVVFMTGSVWLDNNVASTYAYNSDGSLLWNKKLDLQSKVSFGLDMTLSRDESTVFITGENRITDQGDYEIFVSALDAKTGEKVWNTRQINKSAGLDAGRVIYVSPDDSKLYVLAAIDWPRGNTHIYSLDSATGRDVWDLGGHDEYHNGGGLGPYYDLSALSADGKKIYFSSFSELEISAIDLENRDIDWTNNFANNSQNFRFPSGIIAGRNDPSLYTLSSIIEPLDFQLERLDANTGNVVWSQIYRDSDNPSSLTFNVGDLTESHDGSKIYVSGLYPVRDSGAASNNDILTVAYDATNGNKLWQVRYPAKCDIYVVPLLHATKDNIIYRIGESSDTTGGTGYLLNTVSYDQLGNQRWESNRGLIGALENIPVSVTTSLNDSRIYVVGRTSFATFNIRSVPGSYGAGMLLAAYDE